ncbi:tryptophan synthase subunit beta [Patescibacteria group bacterium]|nr:MAG: tryptophan synthase subunit beta [Patescibacteria group bacterium]
MDSSQYFGIYGGRYVPEMLQKTLIDLARVYDQLKATPAFQNELRDLQTTYNNRPTPLTFAKNLTEKLGGAQIYLKNEGMNHTGAHKINHCLGQALVARKLKKTRLIAETGAGQHGVATATVAAKMGFSCTIYMGEVDMNRQRPNVLLMELLGAKVIPVTFGSRTLKDAVSAAMKDLLENSDTTHYVIGSALGPDPYPRMNRDFQSIIGQEIHAQLSQLPDYVVACVGGGSNALGAFTEFINEATVQLIGVEAGGTGKQLGNHATRFPDAKIGIIEGYKSYFLQDEDGNTAKTHSIAAGLDYIGIGPELASLHDSGRVQFSSASDEEALSAVKILAESEGIIPALESAHAVAYAIKTAGTLPKNKTMVINVSGRGDKDLFTLAKHFDQKHFSIFLTEEVRRYEK